MKKVKLLTSLAAFVLVFGLGACEVTQEETPDEGGETTETSDTTETGDTGDTGTTEGGESGETGVKVDCALYGDFKDNIWNNEPAVDSIYYIPAGTTHYEVEVEVPTKETLGYEPAFRVVEYGTWNLVAGYESLDTQNSTGVTGPYGEQGNIGLEGGTYDLVFDFGETNSILVTLQTTEGGNEGYTHTGPEEGDYLFGFELNGTDYYIDGGIIGNYTYEGTYTSEITKGVPVTVKEAEGDDAYTLSFEYGDKTKYITTIVNGSGYTNLNYSETESLLYWNSTYNCWGNESREYFLCYYSNYGCLYCSSISYVATSPIAKLYTIPDGWAPYEEPEGSITTTINCDAVMNHPNFASHTWATAQNTQDCFSSVAGVTTNFTGCSVTWYTGASGSSNGCAIYTGNTTTLSYSLRMYYGASIELSALEGYEIVSVVMNFTGTLSDFEFTNTTYTKNGYSYELTAPADHDSPIGLKNTKTSSNTFTFADAGIVVTLMQTEA